MIPKNKECSDICPICGMRLSYENGVCFCTCEYCCWKCSKCKENSEQE